MKRTAKEQFLLNWDEGDTDNSPTKMERDLENVIIEAQQQVKNLNIPAVSVMCECSEKSINHIGPFYKECGKCGKQIK